jgi:hypothetical protein
LSSQKPSDDVGTGDPEQDAPAHASPLQAAIGGLTSGVQNLVKHHLELARYETKADVLELLKDIAGLGFAAFIVVFGYLLLNIAALSCAAWYGGASALALVALFLAGLHLGAGGYTAYVLQRDFSKRHYGPKYTRHITKESTTWAKETASEQIKEGKHWIKERLQMEGTTKRLAPGETTKQLPQPSPAEETTS